MLGRSSSKAENAADTDRFDSTNGSGYDTATAWKTVGILTIIYWFGTLDRQLMPLLVTPIKNDLHLTDIQIGSLQSIAFSLFYTLATFPIGRLIDTHSRRAVLFTGTLFWTVTSVASGLARSFLQMFGARAAVGAGEATIQPASFAILADIFPAGRLTLPISVFMLGSNLGAGCAFALGGTLFTWLEHSGIHRIPIFGEMNSWQFAFLIAGMPGIPLAFLIFAIPSARPKGLARKAATYSLTEVWMRYRKHISFYLTHNLAFSLCSAFAVGLLAWNPALLGRRYGWELNRIGLWLGVSQILFATIGQPIHGWIVDRMFRTGIKDAHMRYYAVICPFAGVIAALGYLANNPYVTLLCFNLSYFLMLAFAGVGAAAVQIATPAPLRGTFSGIYQIWLGLFGGVLSALGIALITDWVFRSEAHLGQSMAIFAALTMSIATILFIAGLRPMRRAIEDSSVDSDE